MLKWVVNSRSNKLAAGDRQAAFSSCFASSHSPFAGKIPLKLAILCVPTGWRLPFPLHANVPPFLPWVGMPALQLSWFVGGGFLTSVADQNILPSESPLTLQRLGRPILPSPRKPIKLSLPCPHERTTNQIILAFSVAT